MCLLLVLATGIPFTLQPVVNAAVEADACTISIADTGVYSVKVCLTAPADGAVLSRNLTVSATVEILDGVAPAIKFAQFYFSSSDSEKSSTVLRDFITPFVFTLPTDRWSDRAYRLAVQIRFVDGFETTMTGIDVITANGVTRIPRSTGRWVPKDVVSDQPVVVAAVGDAAGGLPGSYDVADLIEGWDPQLLLYLGDIYNTGSYTEFMNYYEPTLGRMKAITDPVPGDHEGGRQFQGYRDYWDSNQDYYAATAGSWRLYALNSTERFDQVTPGTMQYDWLEDQLARDDDAGCTIVYMHTPRWGQKPEGNNDYLDDLWRLLVSEGVDIVIAGDEHNYQRWMPMDAEGNPDPAGTTEFVAGTGGHELMTFSRHDPQLVSNAQGIYGALRLVLRDGSADYEYIDTSGAALDSGEIRCTADPVGVVEDEGTATPMMGTIVDTHGLGALCLAQPDYDAAVITLLPDGTRVELHGTPVGDWQPVRCGDQDGYVVSRYVLPDG